MDLGHLLPIACIKQGPTQGRASSRSCEQNQKGAAKLKSCHAQEKADTPLQSNGAACGWAPAPGPNQANQ